MGFFLKFMVSDILARFFNQYRISNIGASLFWNSILTHLGSWQFAHLIYSTYVLWTCCRLMTLNPKCQLKDASGVSLHWYGLSSKCSDNKDAGLRPDYVLSAVLFLIFMDKHLPWCTMPDIVSICIYRVSPFSMLLLLWQSGISYPVLAYHHTLKLYLISGSF